jgi:hypothetical protein
MTLVIATVTHAPFVGSFAGMTMSGMLFAVPAVFRSADLATSFSMLALALSGLLAGVAISLHLRKVASARFPRTNSVRNNIESLEPAPSELVEDRRFIAS